MDWDTLLSLLAIALAAFIAGCLFTLAAMGGGSRGE